MFQFIKGQTAAGVSIGFVEHGHQGLHHVVFHGLFEGRVLIFVAVVVVIVIGFVLVVVLIAVVVVVVVVILVRVESNPELIPGEVAVVVRIEC